MIRESVLAGREADIFKGQSKLARWGLTYLRTNRIMHCEWSHRDAASLNLWHRSTLFFRRRTGLVAALLWVALAGMLVTPQGEAQTLPAGVVQGASMAGIAEYTFPNGLRALLLPDPGSGSITVNVTYLVGSRHEGYGETGMAHLLEHLNFITSTTGRDIKQELEDHGARWNGTTWYDRTNYFETVNASDENLTWALELETDRMVNMRIEQEILDAEMTVVRNEFELGENSVTGVLEERVLAAAYLWHNYGKSTIGSRTDIENVPIDRLEAFYRRYYQPDNAIVTIGGQIDTSRTLAMLASTLGALPRPTRVLPDTYTEEPAQDGERTVELNRVGSGQNLLIAFHTPSFAHPDAATLEVLSGILAGGGIGRLDRELVDTGKALSVGTSLYELHDPGVMLLSASLNDEQSLEEVRTVLIDSLVELAKNPPTPEEVARAQTRILQRMDRTMADSRNLVMSLNESIASGDWRLFFTNYEELRRVTPEDVQSVAERYFKASNRTVGTFVADSSPQRADVPQAPGIETLLSVYTPEIDISQGEALDPDPLAIESRIERQTAGHGLRLVLLPKETRGARVQATLTLRFGDQTSLAGRQTASEMTGSLLSRGTTTKSRQELQDEMQQLNASINLNGGLTSVTVSISTTAQNLIPAMTLAAEMLQNPIFPESDFEQIRAQRIAALERNRTDPESLVGLTLQRNLSPYPQTDVRYYPTMEEEIADLEEVTLDDVRQFYDDFYGASQGELSVVGQFSPDDVANATERLFGSWESPAAYALIVNDYLDVTEINQTIETPDKENAEFAAGLRIRMNDGNPDYPAMVMANFMFGGGIKARLPERVRNQEGLSYSVGSNFSAPVEGDAAVFSSSAIANPVNIPRVEASFMEELTRAVAGGFTADELNAAKKAWLDDRKGSRSSDGGVLGLMASRERWGRTLQWDADFEARIESLTLDEVNAAFRRYVDPDRVSIVKGGDFREAAVTP